MKYRTGIKREFSNDTKTYQKTTHIREYHLLHQVFLGINSRRCRKDLDNF